MAKTSPGSQNNAPAGTALQPRALAAAPPSPVGVGLSPAGLGGWRHFQSQVPTKIQAEAPVAAFCRRYRSRRRRRRLHRNRRRRPRAFHARPRVALWLRRSVDAGATPRCAQASHRAHCCASGGTFRIGGGGGGLRRLGGHCVLGSQARHHTPVQQFRDEEGRVGHGPSACWKHGHFWSIEALLHMNIGLFTDPRARTVPGGGLSWAAAARGGPANPQCAAGTPRPPPEGSLSVAAWPLNGAPAASRPPPAQPLVARVHLQGPRGCTSGPRRLTAGLAPSPGQRADPPPATAHQTGVRAASRSASTTPNGHPHPSPAIRIPHRPSPAIPG